LVGGPKKEGKESAQGKNHKKKKRAERGALLECVKGGGTRRGYRWKGCLERKE